MRTLLTAAVAALAASEAWGAPAGPPAQAPVDPGIAALERMSDAQRAYTENLSQAYGAKPEDIALLRQNGLTWDDAAQGAALAAGWNLGLAEVASAHAAGHSWLDVHETAKLAKWSGFSFGTVLTLRETGMSWPEVAREVQVRGVDFRDAPRDPDPPKKKAVPAKKKAAPSPKQKPPAVGAGGS